MLIKGLIKIHINSLNLALTLKTGQNFRWKQLDTINNDSTRWLGILNNLYVVQLIQQKDSIEYNVINTDFVLNYLNQTKNKESIETLQKKFDKNLRNYFRLDVDLDNLYELWSECDENFKKTCSKFKGIRLLRQDLIENIFSFICSSNNNIGRITKMIDKLCHKYGNKLYSSKNDIKDNQLINSDVYSFPSIEKLSENQIENDLRKLGFGYRAKFIQNTAKHIMQLSQNKPDQWIHRLKMMSYEDARKELMSLPGIGAKVADCICLMSLEFTESIPVDTHVYKITLKHYLDDLNNDNKSTKSSSFSLTTKRYNEIGDFYRQKFKIHSGWAQTVLFCSDLKIIK